MAGRQEAIFSTISSTDLLEWYGEVLLDDFTTIREAWYNLQTLHYTDPDVVEGFANLRQVMLRYHRDVMELEV